MGRLTGVVDDRGKFICITPEEMDAVSTIVIVLVEFHKQTWLLLPCVQFPDKHAALYEQVANYIREQGRISISQLAANSSQFVDLTEVAEDIDDDEEEEEETKQ